MNIYQIPKNGQQIAISSNGHLSVPNNPIIPFIEGDGIGPDVWNATKLVLDSAIQKAYQGKREIKWMEIFAGEKANEKVGEWLPEKTLEYIEKFHVAIKGPLTTPIGGGFRSLNVSIRQKLELYACVRPVQYFNGVPAPVKKPELVDMVIFRENTEDVYAGWEWKEGSEQAYALIDFLNTKLGCAIRSDSGIGIKPISITGTKRLVRMAIQYALDHQRKSVTIVHKGNIMKFTEGAFRDWGYEVAKDEFRDKIITEQELWNKYNGTMPNNKILVKDRIADAMFQQILTRPTEYDVVALPNLNGDYISDALVAQVGGLGLGPGANFGDKTAVFEATHGTAPKYAGQNKVNPGSLILSGVMMLEHIDWNKPAKLIVHGLKKSIGQKKVTYDLERLMDGATLLKCSEFAESIVNNM